MHHRPGRTFTPCRRLRQGAMAYHCNANISIVAGVFAETKPTWCFCQIFEKIMSPGAFVHVLPRKACSNPDRLPHVILCYHHLATREAELLAHLKNFGSTSLRSKIFLRGLEEKTDCALLQKRTPSVIRDHEEDTDEQLLDFCYTARLVMLGPLVSSPNKNISLPGRGPARRSWNPSSWDHSL